MSTQTFKRQTQIAFDVNVKVHNTDTSGNIVTDDITLYYADSLILDIAMGLYDDSATYPVYMAMADRPYVSITGNNINTPYSQDLRIYYAGITTDIKKYVNSLKDYKKYKDVIKCSPFFRATPLVYKTILGQEPTCVQQSKKYRTITKDLLLNEKDWRDIIYSSVSSYSTSSHNFTKTTLYSICAIKSTLETGDDSCQIPYHYGDGKKYYEMSSSTFNCLVPIKSITQLFGFEIAHQLRQMSDDEYAELVNVWLEKVKETCYEDVKTRVDGEYVGGLNLDFSDFVEQRPYNE